MDNVDLSVLVLISKLIWLSFDSLSSSPPSVDHCNHASRHSRRLHDLRRHGGLHAADTEEQETPRRGREL